MKEKNQSDPINIDEDVANADWLKKKKPAKELPKFNTTSKKNKDGKLMAL